MPTMMSGQPSTPYRSAVANVAAATTDGAVVTAVAAVKIRVHAILILGATLATTLVFNSKPAGAGTAISPLLALGINLAVAAPFSSAGWFETAAGEGLTATTGAGTTVGVLVVYSEI